MNSVTVRLQLEGKELAEAQKLTKRLGFSSVEEALKELMERFLGKKNDIEHITLTKKARLRYTKTDEEFKSGANAHTASSIDDFLAQLNA